MINKIEKNKKADMENDKRFSLDKSYTSLRKYHSLILLCFCA